LIIKLHFYPFYPSVITRRKLFLGYKLDKNFKIFKITAPNRGITDSAGQVGNVGTTVPPSNAGIEYIGANGNTISRATKIIKAWIPGSKFARNGVIQYQNGVDQVKFFDYHTLIYAYSNYGTDQDVWYVGRVNDYIQQLYYTDA
jgi:hypothetical protein